MSSDPINKIKRYTKRGIRNLFLTIAVLLPLLGLLLFNDALMVSASMDKNPWVHWNGLNPTSEVYIAWETETASASYVKYGKSPTEMINVATNPTSATLHRVLLSGLDANTLYYYQASNELGANVYGSGSFRTAPSSATTTNFTFAIISDTQNFMGTGHYPLIANVLGSMNDLSFVAYAGDMAQDAGQTSVLASETRQPTWNYFWQNTASYLKTTPIVSDPGNHDNCNEQTEENLYQRYFGVVNNTHNYYSFNWSRTQFVMAQVADGSDNTPSTDPTHPTYWHDEWLNATLEAGQSLDYRILVFHRALYSSNGGSDELIARFMPIITHYNVSLVFYGHEHCYERFYLQDHTLVCLAGSGGLQNAFVKGQPGRQSVSIAPSFTRVTIDETGITLTTLTPVLTILDQIHFTKNGSNITPDIIKEV